MPQAQRVFRHRLIKLIARGAAPFRDKHLIASKCAQPIAWRGLSSSDSQIGEQVADGAASPYGQSGRDGGSFEEVQMGIDKAGGDGAPRELHQMGAGADESLETRKRSVSDDPAGGNRDGITTGASEDFPFVQNQIGFDRLSGHYLIADPRRAIERVTLRRR